MTAVISSLEKPIALLTEELASNNNSFHPCHASSFWEYCWWVVCDKFDGGNMVATCHFDVCKCKMRGGLVTGHGQWVVCWYVPRELTSISKRRPVL